MHTNATFNMGKSIDNIPGSIEDSATLSIMTLSLTTFITY